MRPAAKLATLLIGLATAAGCKNRDIAMGVDEMSPRLVAKPGIIPTGRKSSEVVLARPRTVEEIKADFLGPRPTSTQGVQDSR